MLPGHRRQCNTETALAAALASSTGIESSGRLPSDSLNNKAHMRRMKAEESSGRKYGITNLKCSSSMSPSKLRDGGSAGDPGKSPKSSIDLKCSSSMSASTLRDAGSAGGAGASSYSSIDHVLGSGTSWAYGIFSLYNPASHLVCGACLSLPPSDSPQASSDGVVDLTV